MFFVTALFQNRFRYFYYVIEPVAAGAVSKYHLRKVFFVTDALKHFFGWQFSVGAPLDFDLSEGWIFSKFPNEFDHFLFKKENRPGARLLIGLAQILHLFERHQIEPNVDPIRIR